MFNNTLLVVSFDLEKKPNQNQITVLEISVKLIFKYQLPCKFGILC